MKRPCRQCGKMFDTDDFRVVRCSDECRSEREREVSHRYKQMKRSRVA